MRLPVILAFILLSMCTFSSLCAQSYLLKIVSLPNGVLQNKINYKQSFSSKQLRDKELQKVLFVLYDNAYLAAQYDSLKEDSLQLTAYLNSGAQYKWAQLKNGNIDEGVLSEIGFREKLYRNIPLNFKDVKQIQENLIIYYENNGYPFASVKLDSIFISNNSFSAQLYLIKNIEKKVDSIILLGNAKIAPVYLYNYLGIKPGSLYSEAQLKKVNTRIAELPFLRAKAPAVVNFTNKHTKLILNLEKKKCQSV